MDTKAHELKRKGPKAQRRKGCDCPRCQGVKTADPKWGFDRAKVHGVRCVVCDKRIGREPFVLDTSLARFGQMFFRHRRCARG
jgi:hypothetical protein